MPNPELKKHLMSLGIFALPLVLVKAAGVFLGGPAGAQAVGLTPVAAVTPGTPAPTDKPSAMTAKQLAAIEYIKSLRTESFSESPLFYTKITEPVVPVVIPEPPEIKPVEDAPVLALGAIMTGSSGKKALINSRPYAEGALIRGMDWVLTSIDAPSRAVTLTQKTTGKTLTLRVEVKTGDAK